MTVGDAIVQVCVLFKKMSLRLKKQLVTYLFRQLVREVDSDFRFLKFVGRDFLDISLEAMKNLFSFQKKNLLYLLGKCFLPPDGQPAGTRMPLDRMPFGLLDYNIHFFAAENTVHLGTEPHYARWLETMYAHFGHKWLCLFRGPTWQYEEERKHVPQKEVDILEMALQASDITLSVDARDVDEIDVDGEDCFTDPEIISQGEGSSVGQKRKRSEALMKSAAIASTSSTNVSTLWSRLDPEDVTEINESTEDPKAAQAATGVNPQQTWQKQNSGIYNPLKVSML